MAGIFVILHLRDLVVYLVAGKVDAEAVVVDLRFPWRDRVLLEGVVSMCELLGVSNVDPSSVAADVLL